MTIKCPECGAWVSVTTEHIRSIVRAYGKVTAKEVKNPGRKPIMRKCPKCGKMHSARDMRKCKD